ncbi:HAD family hydrolase [Intestinirhabdus alba]|jgi:phosphoserine phosphatase|uniref:phosphoserine phosphatase n=1 Tax=Intestinirhabdus alba TaxID=2899544 RepID=A0A6L6IJM7_9ENTR|nr:haloacid dehalogenase-like hydrolase [Intestinirhabdus alba]MTH45796.1 haloacid dehalogenase-like hydrolase [Intestinirhabdus alba]
MKYAKRYIAVMLTINLLSLNARAARVESVPPAPSTAPNITENTPMLQPGKWDSFNKKRLEAMLAKARQAPPHTYYAVFDFDNTTAFLDIEEAALIYQLEHLLFSMSPEELREVILKDIPLTDFASAYNNKNGDPVNIIKVSEDIIESYRWLHDNYPDLTQQERLVEIRRTPHYQNFITKMRYLYAAIGGTFRHEVSYPWVTYLFKNMTPGQVADLTQKTIAWQRSTPVESVLWESPAALPGKAGVVSVTWHNGFRLVPEMQDLYQALQKAGVDVYVISASNLEVIKSIVTRPPYSVPETQVFAMRLLHTSDGKLTAGLDPDYPQTQGKGKTETIRKFIQNKYAGKGPLLVAGDSEGDQNMMSDFPDTEVVLIINRLRPADSVIGQLSKRAVEEYKQKDAKILLQGRNDNTGEFIAAQIHYPLGKKIGQKVK